MTFYDGRKRPITAEKALQNAKRRLKVTIEESGNIYTLTLKKVIEYGIPRECLIIERETDNATGEREQTEDGNPSP